MNNVIKVVSSIPGVSVKKMEAEINLREIPKQVSDFIPHLKSGSSYLFNHARKGPFVAKFLSLVPRENDPQDMVLLELEIMTSDGSGQARLALAKTRDAEGNKISTPSRIYNCRPSWLLSIESPSVAVQRQLQKEWEDLKVTEEAAGLIPSYPSATTLKALQDTTPIVLPVKPRSFVGIGIGVLLTASAFAGAAAYLLGLI